MPFRTRCAIRKLHALHSKITFDIRLNIRPFRWYHQTGISHIKLPGPKQRTILDESHGSVTHDRCQLNYGECRGAKPLCREPVSLP